jgi:hypothetical protein
MDLLGSIRFLININIYNITLIEFKAIKKEARLLI